MLAMSRTGYARPLVKAAAAAALAAMVGGLATACGGSGAADSSAPAVPGTPAVTGTAGSGTASPAASGTSPAAGSSATPLSWPVVVPVPAAVAGQHQTRTRPPADSPVFRAEMTDLWAAVASGRPDLGLPAFFPLVAYKQVKAIFDPAADWRGRLVAEFRADVMA